MSDESNNGLPPQDENPIVPAEETQIPPAEEEIQMKDYPYNIEDIMHTAYLQYSLSVNVGRAIPDVRDGLKPVNRRILYGMKKLGLTKSHSTVKCARVVGEVMGKYHPHGDAAVYDALVRLAQWFSLRNPLIEGQGNFGTIDGDPAAASRYTECRMERIAEEMLADLDKDTVNMIPNFDETEVEPEVLPAKFPNLLVNGSMGIGVGMATNIPPHNLGEIIDGAVYIMENPSATASDLMKYIPGPDFPTGGIIYGLTPIRKFYETGHGVIKVRAKAEIVEKNGKESIIVTEIPYGVNKELMVKRIADLVKDKKIVGITGLRDETSSRAGIRVVIEVKRGAMASVILTQLFANTQMETIIGCNMLVVDMNRPKILTLPQVLQRYIDHRLDVVTRRTRFELNKAEARKHILDGLLIAVNNLDEVVKIIRSSRVREEAQEALIARFGFSKIQVRAILDMRLYQLTGLAIEDLQNEYNELVKEIEYLKSLLASRELRLGVIKAELLEVKEKYATKRLTEITHDTGDIDIADLIPHHSCVITVSNTGYIKRVPADTYETQHRGGKGIIGMETKDEDYVEHLFNADSHDIILFFTNKGIMHWLNVYEVPEGARTGKGRAITNLLKVGEGEQIRSMITIRKDMFENPDFCVAMATRNGVIKKTPLREFKNLRKIGIRAVNIDDGDDIVAVEIVDGHSEIILSTEKGMACRFYEQEVRAMGRAARGVTGIRFKLDGDCVVGMEVVPAEGAAPQMEELPEGAEAPEVPEVEEPAVETEGEDSEEIIEDTGKPQLLIVTSGGMGKRSYVEHYRLTRRGAKGVKNINLREGETVVAAIQISHGDEIIITTERGQVVRIPVDEIRIVGRNSKGVKIMDLRKGDKITGVARLKELEALPGEEERKAAEAEAAAEAPAENTEAVSADSAASAEAIEVPEESDDDSGTI